MTSRWAPSLFKGRIGEAVIEAILSEFGYRVERAGYEQVSTGNTPAAPDLVVTDPRTRERQYVEVKYRSARPTAVQLDGKRLAAYRQQYPGTILAISSAWDGAIYCSQVEDLPFATTTDVFTVSLLEDYWRPLRRYFTLVKQGDRLKQTWHDIQSTLSMYGTRQVFGRRDQTLWDGEYEALARLLEETWSEEMLQLGIEEPHPERMTLEELWEAARHIHAVGLVEELLEPSEDNPVESRLMQQVLSRALGRRGEQLLTFDLATLAGQLGLGQDDSSLLAMALLLGRTLGNRGNEDADQLIRRLLRELEDGIGVAYLEDQALPVNELEPVDLKTAIKLLVNPCRIDA